MIYMKMKGKKKSSVLDIRERSPEGGRMTFVKSYPVVSFRYGRWILKSVAALEVREQITQCFVFLIS